MARMMVDEQCCVSSDLCRSTAVGRHLRARAAPDRPPSPPARQSAQPAAALRPRALRGISGDFSLQRFLQHVSAFCPWVFFWGQNLANFRYSGLQQIFSNVLSNRKDVFAHNWNGHSPHSHCKRTQTTRTCSHLSGGTAKCCVLLSSRMIKAFYLGIVMSIHLYLEIEQHRRNWCTGMMMMMVWWCWWFSLRLEKKPFGTTVWFRICFLNGDQVGSKFCKGSVPSSLLVTPPTHFCSMWFRPKCQSNACSTTTQKRHPLTHFVGQSQSDWLELWFVNSFPLQIWKAPVVHLSSKLVRWRKAVEGNGSQQRSLCVAQCLILNQVAV